MATDPSRRRTITPRRDHSGSIIETTGESPQSICAVRRKIVKGRLGPVLETIAPFAPILAKRLDTSLASCRVDPGSTEHPPNKVDTIEDVERRDNSRFNSHSGQGIPTRL